MELEYNPLGGGGIDADAQAFITAASITDNTQKSAINTLVTQLKTYGIWTKMKAIYPFVGGTATTHKFNLKDPRDLDAAYRLVFSGGWTHSSTGAAPNGTTGYANTKLNAFNILTNSNVSVSTYLRSNTLGTLCDIGVYESGTEKIISIYSREGDGNIKADIGTHLISRISVTNNNSQGFYTIKRTANNNLKLLKNGNIIGANTNIDNTGLAPKNILISALDSGTSIIQYSPREQAFASIGDGLTDTEAANLYTAVQTFQTTLGRAV